MEYRGYNRDEFDLSSKDCTRFKFVACNIQNLILSHDVKELRFIACQIQKCTIPKNLEIFEASQCGIDELPNLPKTIKVLELGGNNIQNMDLSKFENLMEYHICENPTEVHEIPKTVKVLSLNKMCDISHLDLYRLNLIGINLDNSPENIQAKHLDISNNKIKHLKIKSEKLLVLVANNNQIESVEFDCPNMVNVNLDNNNLKELPLNESIRSLSVKNNQIKFIDDIPKNLKMLEINGNPIERITYPFHSSDIDLRSDDEDTKYWSVGTMTKAAIS